MDIVLIAGLWLPASVWDQTAAELKALDHQPHPVALPGADDGDRTATLADQLDSVLAVVDHCERPFVVGHSAAANLAWMVADRRPSLIAGVGMLGGMPATSGSVYADFFDITGDVMKFPGWEAFEGPDVADLDAAARGTLAGIMVPVPASVATAVVELSNPQRYQVPTIMLCPEYTPDDVRAWQSAGELPELDQITAVRYVNLETGHWPMVSQPSALAAAVATVVGELQLTD